MKIKECNIYILAACYICNAVSLAGLQIATSCFIVGIFTSKPQANIPNYFFWHCHELYSYAS